MTVCNASAKGHVAAKMAKTMFSTHTHSFISVVAFFWLFGSGFKRFSTIVDKYWCRHLYLMLLLFLISSFLDQFFLLCSTIVIKLLAMIEPVHYVTRQVNIPCAHVIIKES